MIRGSCSVHGAAGAVLLLAACGEQAPSTLTYDQVGGQLAKGGDGFAAYLEALPNRTVAWSGTVVELRRWHEDDYVEAAGVLVDLDGRPGGDAMMAIKVGDADRIKAGAPLAFVAVLTGVQDEGGRPILRLEARSLK